MFFQQANGTSIRWVWSELEPVFRGSYLWGTLTSAINETDSDLPITVSAPFPSGLPLTVYLEAEQATLTAADPSCSLTRGVNGTTAAAHAAGVRVFCDSFQPVARDYSLRNPPAPLHFGTHTLCYCEMTGNQIKAAAQDPRLVVLDARYDAVVPDAIATALSSYGVTAGMTLAQLLQKLGETEPQFIPDI
jgi:hypothetical protein